MQVLNAHTFLIIGALIIPFLSEQASMANVADPAENYSAAPDEPTADMDTEYRCGWGTTEYACCSSAPEFPHMGETRVATGCAISKADAWPICAANGLGGEDVRLEWGSSQCKGPAAPPPPPPPTEQKLRVCNNAGETVDIAIGYRRDDGSLMSEGWYSLSNGECGFVPNTYPIRGTIYAYAKAGNKYWISRGAGTGSFCVNMMDVFTYTPVDCTNPSEFNILHKEFGIITDPDGDGVHHWNLSG